MTVSTQFSPDRWLVCSEKVFHSISKIWAADAPSEGLFKLRLEQKFIEATDFASLSDKLIELRTSGVHTAYLVINEMTEALASSLLQIRESVDRELDLRILEWKVSPLDVIASLSAPDRYLLDQLLESAPTATPPINGNSSLLNRMPQWWPPYFNALKHWEQAAREVYGMDFDELYSPQSIPWDALAPRGIQSSPALHLVPRTADSDDAFQSNTIPISNAIWRQETLMPMAAADHMFLDLPVEITSEKYSGDWNLTTATVVGEKAQYLIFECDPDKVQEYEGRPVHVTLGVTTLDLGVVDHQGIAELRVSGLIDLLQKITVVIGDRLED
jgi:hypothetical protein